jgi:hypothetical protein
MAQLQPFVQPTKLVRSGGTKIITMKMSTSLGRGSERLKVGEKVNICAICEDGTGIWHQYTPRPEAGAFFDDISMFAVTPELGSDINPIKRILVAPEIGGTWMMDSVHVRSKDQDQIFTRDTTEFDNNTVYFTPQTVKALDKEAYELCMSDYETFKNDILLTNVRLFLMGNGCLMAAGMSSNIPFFSLGCAVGLAYMKVLQTDVDSIASNSGVPVHSGGVRLAMIVGTLFGLNALGIDVSTTPSSFLMVAAGFFMNKVAITWAASQKN